jgi:glutathione S-transferase
MLPDLLGRLETFAQKNNGYLVAGRVWFTPQKIEFCDDFFQLTWADLFLISVLTGVDHFIGADVFKNYPNLLNLQKKVLEIPGIKKWVENRPKDIFRPTK